MNITLNQYSLDELVQHYFDISIVASGFEKRASFQATTLKTDAKKKIALGFVLESDDKIRIDNDKKFRSANYDLVTGNGVDFEERYIDQMFDDIELTQNHKNEINIHIDYSSMSRNWYARILLRCKRLSELMTVNVYFGYSFAKHDNNKKEETLNEIVEPIFGYCKLSVPHKPTALIICLGNEFSRVYGLKDYFDATTYLFYSDARFGNSFSEEVEKINEDLLLNTNPEHIFKYPIEDLVFTDQMLENLCRALNEKYRVIIAPCGPKPFTLLSMINSIKLNNDIEVWRISPGSSLQKIDREPSGIVSFLKVTLKQ